MLNDPVVQLALAVIIFLVLLVAVLLRAVLRGKE